MVPSNPSTQAFSSPLLIRARIRLRRLVHPLCSSFPKDRAASTTNRPKQAHKASFANSFSNVAITVVASTQIDFDLFLAIVTVLIALQFTDPTLICDGTVPAQSLLYDLTSSRNSPAL
ncbi:hypothetical protein H9L39_10300 [Fusarium oxysporum f. sp. albedinis]|nr:hypothetical protein H9L39_10300 [Fusarium oxysporum f. sp. albedinis]